MGFNSRRRRVVQSDLCFLEGGRHGAGQKGVENCIFSLEINIESRDINVVVEGLDLCCAAKRPVHHLIHCLV